MNTITNPLAATAMPGTTLVSNAPVSYKSIKVDDLNIAYREAGNPSDPKLVLLHGFPAG